MSDRETLEAVAEETKPPPPPADATEVPEFNGIVIPVTYVENGDVQLDVLRQGEVRVTEIETILKQALKMHQARIGVA